MQQVEACAKILAWAHETHGIPLQLCPDSRPGSRGLAYHRQGIDGNFDPPAFRFPGRVSGGEVWTTSFGKVCPTDVRIAQLPDILARAKQIVNGEEPDDMALDDKVTAERTVKQVLQRLDKFIDGSANRDAAAAKRDRADAARDAQVLKLLGDLPDKVVSKLPPDSAGGMTRAQVRSAVVAGLRDTLGSLNDPKKES